LCELLNVVLTRQVKLSSFTIRKEPEYQTIFHNFFYNIGFDLYARLKTYTQTDRQTQWALQPANGMALEVNDR